MPLSKSQIKRLGERLGHSEVPTPEDLELLDELERAFEPAQTYVINAIRGEIGELGINPTARPKSVRSIVAKLRREHTALSRMQDIVGCRLVVEDVIEQDGVVDRLLGHPWDRCKKEDRRERPSHGYRAIHLIVEVAGLPIEIQIRSRAQDLWAQISEKMADTYGLEVKYGGGPAEAKDFLMSLSDVIADIETHLLAVEELTTNPPALQDLDLEVETLKARARDLHARMIDRLNSFVVTLSE